MGLTLERLRNEACKPIFFLNNLQMMMSISGGSRGGAPKATATYSSVSGPVTMI